MHSAVNDPIGVFTAELVSIHSEKTVFSDRERLNHTLNQLLRYRIIHPSEDLFLPDTV